MSDETTNPSDNLTLRNVSTYLIILVSYAAFVGSLATELQYLGMIIPCVWCTALRWIAFANGGLGLFDIFLKFESRNPFFVGVPLSIAGLAISVFNVNLQVIGICLFNCVSVPVFGVDLFVWALGVMASTFGLQLLALIKTK
jgi:hypothetical protein